MAKQILLVEDDPSLLKLMQTILTSDRYDYYLLTGVNNGNAAIERMERQIFDLVISDENLPGIKGHEIAEWMRRNRRYGRVPLILMSAENDHRLFSDLLKNRLITFYLPKPFSIMQFESLVSMSLNLNEKIA
jgi:CheY-like chemotaxis protein